MAEDPQQLMEQILRSGPFRGAGDHSGILEYICYQTQAGGLNDLREHDIGVAVLGLEPGYDVRENPVVSRLTDEVRDRLKSYFQREGRRERIRLAIPKGEFRAFFYEADPRQLAAAAPSAVDLFWAPYWHSDRRNLLIHGELPGEAMLIPEAYVSVQLAVLFESKGNAVRLQPASALAAESANLILVGTPETNPMLCDFLTEPLDCALVQRIWASGTHGVVTILAAPEPQGILDAAKFVMNEEALEQTAEKSPGGDFAQNFRMTLNRK